MRSGAVFSKDKKHRYVLFRIWNPKKPMVCFVGLNPSKAGGKDEDHTTRKLRKFCENAGLGGYYLVNLFSRIATGFDEIKSITQYLVDGGAMLNTEYSIKNLERWTKEADIIIPMWGGKGVFMDRDQEVLEYLWRLNKPLYTFGLTKKRNPGHPLMLGYTTVYLKVSYDYRTNTLYYAPNELRIPGKT